MVATDAALLAVLLIFGSCASAFYPIHQALQDGGDRLGGSEYKAGAEVHGLTERGDTTLERPGIFISIAPFRSSSRYRVRSSSTTESHPILPRDSAYQIISATPPTQSNSVAIDEDGTDYSYVSAVGVGSKAQKLDLLIDTGSALTWVMDESCKSGPCKSHRSFASSQSSSIKTGGDPFTLDYGTGEVSGKFATDGLSFAGLDVTIPVGLADTVSDDFQNYPFDGILGLARVPLNGSPSVTLLQQLANLKTLPANVFGVNLQRHADGSSDGELNFGAPDTSKYHGDLNWTDTVTDNTFWEVPADDIFVDGKSVGLNQQRSAILDTGTSYMLIPPNDAKALLGAIKGAQASDNGYWNLPCDAKSDIQVVFSGVGYSISPKDYIGNRTSGNTCVSNIIGVSAAGDDKTWLLGDTFLKNVYAVFDADKNRIGLGTKTGATKVGTGSSTTSAASGSATASSTSGSSASKPSVTGAVGLPVGQASSTAGSVSSSGGTAAATGSGAPSTGAAGKMLVNIGWSILVPLAVLMFVVS